MLALLFTEAENPEFLDAATDGVSSLLESSERRGLSSKLVTVRIVEFIRVGICCCCCCIYAGIDGRGLRLTPFASARDMAAFMVPLEARVRVDRVDGRSCGGLDGLLRVSSPEAMDMEES